MGIMKAALYQPIVDCASATSYWAGTRAGELPAASRGFASGCPPPPVYKDGWVGGLPNISINVYTYTYI